MKSFLESCCTLVFKKYSYNFLEPTFDSKVLKIQQLYREKGVSYKHQYDFKKSTELIVFLMAR